MGKAHKNNVGRGAKAEKASKSSGSHSGSAHGHSRKTNSTDYLFSGGDASDWARALPDIIARFRAIEDAWELVNPVVHADPNSEMEFSDPRPDTAANLETALVSELSNGYTTAADRKIAALTAPGAPPITDVDAAARTF